jgi:hypothetical protein
MHDPLSSVDFPANPLEKSGYKLEFNDEFDQPGLDTHKWLPFYLPHWSSMALSRPDYFRQNGSLVLQITKDQQPWCPEFDGEVKCSSIQTGEFAGPVGSKLGQHRFNPECTVREAQNNIQTYAPQYGYFELRAKGVKSAANHVSLWMIGYEDTPDRSGEIDLFEIMGASIRSTTSQVGYGVRRLSDPMLEDEFYEEFFQIDAAQYHIYGMEWFPTHLDFYIDNRKIKTCSQSPKYPMQFMFSLYELPSKGGAASPNDQDAAYPKEFTIDYFRAYQPVGGYGG